MKGFDFLIEAVGQMPAANRPPLVIASNFQNPPERAYLEALAAEHGVELRLEGNVTEEKLRSLYNQAMITVYSPIREPFGLVPIESMACGTPVVSVREGGTQETILHEQTGLLVERDPAQFAQAIQRLWADREMVVEYGRAGRQHILQNWTWDRAVDTLEGYFGEMVNRQLTINN